MAFERKRERLTHTAAWRYDERGVYRGDCGPAVGYLKHFGVDGQEWGNRQYQYEDGSLTPLGRIHYGVGEPREFNNFVPLPTESQYKADKDLISENKRLKEMKDENGKPMYTELQRAEMLGIKNTNELRKKISLATAAVRTYEVDWAMKLRDKGMNYSEIGRAMGKGDTSVRNLLNETVYERMTAAQKNAEVLKERLKNHDYIDVGKGSEEYMGVSSHSLSRTLKLLENEGYSLIPYQIDQLGTGKKTNMMVLAKPGTEWKEVKNNEDKIAMVKDVYSEDGVTMRSFQNPVSIDPKRIDIRYAEDGGVEKDGVIELRRGVQDLDLGKNHYAQVRIAVDDTHYLKGMAMYADDLPPGIDIRFNTNKHKGTPMMVKDDPDAKQVLKPMKAELENPFGANIKPDDKLMRAQSHYIDKETGEEKQSALNIVNEEGDWSKWSRTIASQMASKQPPNFAKRQLQQAFDNAKTEFDEIMAYTNPTVKAKMLEDLAGRIDSDAVHLTAAKVPRQTTRVLLPLDIADNEIYAPGYKTGEQLALVRYPHQSTAEIPILTVNNDNPKAKKIIGDALDAVGINLTSAQRLSGADFDGDTAIVIPTKNVKIENQPYFKELEGFDAKEAYPAYPGMTPMTSKQKGMQMGIVTNLLNDIQILGGENGRSSPDMQKDVIKVIRHAYTIIDSEKHKLDWKRSEQENDIREIMKKYRGDEGGAGTFISRSTSPMYIPERKEKRVSNMTPEEKERWKNGEVIWENTGKINKITDFPRSLMTKEEKKLWDSGDNDKIKQVKDAFYDSGRVRVIESPKLEEVKKGDIYNPYDLVSGGSRENTTVIERIYADHAVAMKDLARECRKQARAVEDIPMNKEAKKQYAEEVKMLEDKLSEARRNAPLERMAQRIAKSNYNRALEANPTMDKEHQKREKGRQLDYARRKVGAGKKLIGSKDNPLTEREWEAIQAGAVSKTTLKSILDNADMRVVKQYAMPKTKYGISDAKLAMAKAYHSRGMSRDDICDILDISESTLINAIGLENW